MTSPPLKLRQIQCTGTPQQLGHAQGEQLKSDIHAFVEQRFDALNDYMSERQRLDIDGFLRAGARCLEIAGSWDPAGTRELSAIAEAADIEPARLYAAGNMTDVRDIVLLPPSDRDEGCSAFVLPPELSCDSSLYAAQTWDLNPTDIDFVVAVHRKPAEGPETWSITCVGCLSLMGMNEHGVTVGTTNIKARDTRPGVGYLSLLHRALSQSDAAAAADLIRVAPRAAAHTYWLADSDSALELECSATRALERKLGNKPLTRTNHCLAPELALLQGEPTSPSSTRRLERLERWLGQGNQSIETIQALFADRADGLLSINRYVEDATGTSTNACMIGVPARRELWACQGPADRGAWVQLGFD